MKSIIIFNENDWDHDVRNWLKNKYIINSKFKTELNNDY